MPHSSSTLTMHDIADLAHVRRQAVSMWRRRPRVRGQLAPFPRPVTAVDGVERFDRDEIVAWLAATGRGNNPDFSYDAPALTIPEIATLDEIVLLVCLYSLTGEQFAGLDHDGLVALADEVDPDDEFLLREVRAMRVQAETLGYVDDLIEASYGAADALTRVEAGRLNRRAPERGLTDATIEIMRAVANACRTYADNGDTTLVHGGDKTLSLALAADFAGLVVPGDEPIDRAVRRRAIIAGVETTQAVTTASVNVASIVGLGIDAALERLDEVVVDLGGDDMAVVVGSAAILCDTLRGGSDKLRSETLRTGHMMMAARLPRGSWRAAPRQHLGLWVLHGGHSTQRPRLADLSAIDGTLDLGDLASDVVGALERTDDRAFRYARLGDLAPILAGGRPIVPVGVRAVQLGKTDAQSHLDRIHTATLITSPTLDGYDLLAQAATGTVVLRHRSIGELRGAGHVIMKRGSRLDTEHADPTGTVAVASATGEWDGVRFDPFDVEQHYPRAVRTEPGDVVFTGRPRPMARVDAHGGSLVASPSRILRLTQTAPIGPYALAAIVNEMAPEGSEWETWSVPVIPEPAAQILDDAIRDTQAYRAELQRRDTAAQDLTKALIEGVAAGTITLDAEPTTTGITAQQEKVG